MNLDVTFQDICDGIDAAREHVFDASDKDDDVRDAALLRALVELNNLERHVRELHEDVEVRLAMKKEGEARNA